MRITELLQRSQETNGWSIDIRILWTAIETVNDYKEIFDFPCTALGIREEQQKALFLTFIGCNVFMKVKSLASPTPLTDFKTCPIRQGIPVWLFGKITDACKTNNFVNYLDTVLRDQLVYGLCDQKT